MELKTIWVINQFAGTPQSGWGERHFYLAKRWKELGYNVKIISGSYNHMFTNIKETKGLYTIENYDGIEIYWVKTPKYTSKSVFRFFSMLVFAWNVYRLPVNVIGVPSTIIVSSMPIFSIWTGLKLKKKYNVKLIFEIRDIWPLTLQMLGGYSNHHLAVKFIGWFEKIGYQNSDEIVSLLPNARHHIEYIAKRVVNFTYIPNGIDDSLQIRENDNEVFSLPKDKFIFGYTGTVGLANAMDYFIDAAILLKDDKRFHFLIVGDGYSLNDMKLKAHGLDNITFMSKVEKSKVQSVLKHVDVCFISWHKSKLYDYGVSANKYFDYMLAAKPIIVASDFITDPVVLSGCGLVVPAESPNAIVAGILQMYVLTKSQRNQMGEKGKEYVLQNHSIKNLAVQYAALFK